MANLDTGYPLVVTNRGAKGQKRTDAASGQIRGGGYGEQYVTPVLGDKRIAECLEGSYFYASNPTPFTAITGHAAATTLDDTKPSILIKNNNSVASGIELIMDFLELQVVGVGTNGTDERYAMKLDDASVARYTSGGSLLAAVSTNMGSSAASAAVIHAGAMTAAAASANARIVSHGVLRPVISVLGDIYRFNFGGDAGEVPATAIAGSAISHIVVPVPPVVLAPGQHFLFHLIQSAQSVANTFECRMGFIER